MTTFDEYLRDQLANDPEFRREWERTEALHSAISDTIHLRIVQGLTQAQLAERMGRQQPSIGRFEAGNTNPTLGFLQDIAEALGARLVVRIEPIEAAADAPEAKPRRGKAASSSQKRRSEAVA
jgi:DNA-binding XRE family transcriptional regulator